MKKESKKTNVQIFLESCTDQELEVLLRYTKAQLEDRLALATAMQDPTNSVQEMDFNGMVNRIVAQNAEPVVPEKMIPQEMADKIIESLSKPPIPLLGEKQ